MPNDDELEKVRYHLNKMIISCKYSTEELLKVSQELDLLVLKSMKEKAGVTDGTLVEDEMMSEWENALDKLQVFEKMYEAMRIVDPVNNLLSAYSSTRLKKFGTTYYLHYAGLDPSQPRFYVQVPSSSQYQTQADAVKYSIPYLLNLDCFLISVE